MGRVKLEMPFDKIASISIPVRITDINYGNHLGNDAFVGIIHEARANWLKQNNYTELNIEGTGLILADLAIEFKHESFYGDIIEVAVAVGEIAKVNFELYYRLTVNRDNKDVVLALAKTGMVCYDYALKKIMPLPDKLNALLQKKI